MADEHERKEILELLASMGIKLPESTKVPLGALEERLANALDRGQRYDEVRRLGEKVDQSVLSPWTKENSLREATLSCSLEEKLVGAGPVGSYNELRIMLSDSIGIWYEKGFESVFVCTDPAKDRLVKVKINGVLKATDDVPLTTVEYTFGRGADDDEEGMKIINSSGAHTLFRKLLVMNASRTKEDGASSIVGGPIPSFLLPLGPLSLKDIGSLSKDVGCVVCGNPGLKQCSRCHTVNYCGADCQRTDWNRHKPACLALNTGTWIRFSYATDMYSSILSRTARSANDWSDMRQIDSGPNIHGDDPFLAKVQLSSPGGVGILVYDRQRSFSAQFWRQENPENFQRLENVVATGYLGLKIYLWAKRIDDHTLSICLDRIPDQSTIAW